MAARSLDADIDRLYQLPLDEFTAARNALAKQGGAAIKQLVKPPVAAWAVNQLYWHDRAAWGALIAASEAQRTSHKAVLSGKGGDVRAVGRSHDEAVEAALKRTLALLADGGHPVTDATRQAIATTLRALPGEEAPGRLSRVLQPGGFEMLAGLSIAAGSRVAAKPKPAAPAPAKSTTAKAPKPDAKALARAREAVASAERELREAEHTAKREEFEAARTAREADKVERRVNAARAAFEEARQALEEAEADEPPATRAREAAARRAKKADDVVEAARARLAAAASALQKL